MKERKHSSTMTCVEGSSKTYLSCHPIQTMYRDDLNGLSRCVTQECGLPSHEIGPAAYFYRTIPSTTLIASHPYPTNLRQKLRRTTIEHSLAAGTACVSLKRSALSLRLLVPARPFASPYGSVTSAPSAARARMLLISSCSSSHRP
jgi:hypothetical protein